MRWEEGCGLCDKCEMYDVECEGELLLYCCNVVLLYISS